MVNLNGFGPSDRDTINLVFAIESRFLDLCGAFQRIHKVPLMIQDDIEKAYLRWKSVLERYKTNDFRHSTTELKAIREFAQWMVDVNCLMRNQDPRNIEWKN